MVQVTLNLSLGLIQHQAMKIESSAEVKVWINTFLTSALDRGEWSTLRPAQQHLVAAEYTTIFGDSNSGLALVNRPFFIFPGI